MLRIAMFTLSLLLLAYIAISFAGETDKNLGKQTPIISVQSPSVKTPRVVIYTLSTCPHCIEAKEYLKNNNIPFIDRQIDKDEEYMANLIKIYDSMGIPDQNRGVPLFVIDNRIRIQGFNKQKLQDALKEVTSKPK